MELILLGVDVSTDSGLLDKASAFVEPIPETLRDLSAVLDEALVLSTCNRVEIYGVVDDADAGFESLDAYVNARSDIHAASSESGFYRLRGREVAAHLFMVTAGLKSMVPGDAQITGQVRSALKEAVNAGTAGQIIHLAFEHALRASRNVRSGATRSGHSESVAAAAVDLIPTHRIPMQSLNAVIVGAGQTGALATRLLAERGAGSITVVNRNHDRARNVADRYGGRAIGLGGLQECLLDADLVISATGAPTHVISADALSAPQIVGRSTPLTVIDLAIPGDVESAAFGLPNVDLYDIYRIGDLLRNRSDDNDFACEGDAYAAIQEQLVEFDAGERAARRGSLIQGMVSEAESVQAAELERAIRVLQRQGVDPELVTPVLNSLARSVTRKILHAPITYIRTAESDDSAKDALRLFRRAANNEPVVSSSLKSAA